MTENYHPNSAHLHHRQRSHNPNLIKDEVGRTRIPYQDLPPDSHTYGGRERSDRSGTADAMVWHGHRPSTPPTPPIDYERLNKSAVAHKATTPKKVSKFREEHGDPRVPRRARSPDMIPSDVYPDWSYGTQNRSSSPMRDVISNQAGREAEEEIEDRYNRYDDERTASNGKFKIKSTKSSRGHRRKERSPSPDAKDLWKMSKFENASPTLQQDSPLTRGEDGRLRRVSTSPARGSSREPRYEHRHPTAYASESDEERYNPKTGRKWAGADAPRAGHSFEPRHGRRRAKDGKLYTQPEFEAKFGSKALVLEWNELPVVDFSHDGSQNARCDAPRDKMYVSRREIYKQNFDDLDISNDGYLDYAEMKRLLRRGNPDIPDKDLRKVFQSLDKNRDGRVNFDEFYDYLHDEEEMVEVRKKERRHDRQTGAARAEHHHADSRHDRQTRTARAEHYSDAGPDRQTRTARTEYYSDSEEERYNPKTGRKWAGADAPKAPHSFEPRHGRRRAKDGKLYTQPEFEEKFGSVALLTEWNDLPVVDFSHDAAANERCEAPRNARREKYRQKFDDYRRIFNDLDTNGDDRLDFKEMTRMLKAGNPSMSEKQMRRVFNDVDQNNDGTIDFGEFYDYLYNDSEQPVSRRGYSDNEPGRREQRVERHDCERRPASRGNEVSDMERGVSQRQRRKEPEMIETSRPRTGARSIYDTEVTFLLTASISRQEELTLVASTVERGIRTRFPDSSVRVAGWFMEDANQGLREKGRRYVEWGQGALKDENGAALAPLTLKTEIRHESQEELSQKTCTLVDTIHGCFQGNLVQVRNVDPPLWEPEPPSPPQRRLRDGLGRPMPMSPAELPPAGMSYREAR